MILKNIILRCHISAGRRRFMIISAYAGFTRMKQIFKCNEITIKISPSFSPEKQVFTIPKSESNNDSDGGETTLDQDCNNF